MILDESTDITSNKNLCLLSKTHTETTFIGIVSLDDGRGVTIANATKKLFEKYCTLWSTAVELEAMGQAV